MKNAQELKASLDYWKNKAKEVRRDPSIFSPSQPEICRRNIRQLTEQLKSTLKTEKAGKLQAVTSDQAAQMFFEVD